MVYPNSFTIALLPGDGNGAVLAQQARCVLHEIEKYRPGCRFQVQEHPTGGTAIDSGLAALPNETLEAYLRSDAVILCCCGGVSRLGNAPEEALSQLRQALGVYANIRRVQFPSTALVSRSSFKPEIVEDLDITFVRDLTGGIYYGTRREADQEHDDAFDTTYYPKSHIERLANWAGLYALQSDPQKPVFSVDKANVMATSRLWRSTVAQVFSSKFPTVPYQHILVDAAAMLSSSPTDLDGIILTDNLFGDILSDQAASILNAPNVLASTSLATPPGQSHTDKPAIFEPLNLKSDRNEHDNALAIIQSVFEMLKFGLGLKVEPNALNDAIRRTLDSPELIGADIRTKDLGGTTAAEEFMEVVLDQFNYFLNASAEIALKTETPALEASTDTAAASPIRPMGVVEKIIANAAIGLSKAQVASGDLVTVQVDWTVTSELLWAGMEKTYNSMNRPRPYRNDRVWLAVDHTADPRSNHLPRQRGLIEKAKFFKRQAKIVDFLPANTNIMHTDFTRDRA